MTGLRVIAGKAKGFKLRRVRGEGVRPIGDRVKQALFNIIGVDVEGCSLMDLFGGTGSVGIEALSRGAHKVVFIESNRRAVHTIKENLAHTGLEQGAQVVHMDAFVHLKRDQAEPFDYVYAAPPQYKGMWARAVVELDRSASKWLNPDAWVIAQLHPKEYESLNLDRLTEFDQRRYGNTLLVFYSNPGE